MVIALQLLVDKALANIYTTGEIMAVFIDMTVYFTALSLLADLKLLFIRTIILSIMDFGAA